MNPLTWMQPRDHHAAARVVSALCAVGALVTLALSPLLPAENQMGASDMLFGAGVLAVVLVLTGLARYSSAANVLAWAVCPLLAVVALVALDLLTDDATVDALIYLVFPVLYGASQLRPAGSIVMTTASVLGEAIVVGALLPARSAVAEGGYVASALIATSVMLTLSSARQARLVARLEQMAAIDSLTGLVTRRVFDEAAASALTGASSEEGTSLILIDVDEFKGINDAYGHPGGDEVLVQLARLVQLGNRRGDVVCRLGGDEIAVLMPGCSRDDAQRRAEQQLAEIRAHNFHIPGYDEPVKVSVSMGLAHSPTEADDVHSLYTTADAALYRAKHEGRGRVAVAETPPDTPVRTDV